MGHHPKRPQESNNETTKEKLLKRRKERKSKLKEKRARLVIHNLPFDVTESKIREHFEKYGDIDTVQILKKEDGHSVGCAFIQYKLVQKAAKARHHANGKAFFGRDITVDFAVAKDKYAKRRDGDDVQFDPNIKIKDEPAADLGNGEIKKEDEERAEMDGVKKEEDEEGQVLGESDEIIVDEARPGEDEVVKDSNNSTDDHDDDDDSEDEKDEEEMESVQEDEKKPRIESNDVSEGKTVFIKNVPFTATNDDLRECISRFGPVYYALICMDKFTDHSKGTAFVKFQNQEDAEKALNAGTELNLMGNILDCHKALGRNEIQQKSTDKVESKKQPKDTRNLYLVKEGVIMAGSKAAEGVSAGDMAKRLQIEQYKTQMLRNLNMFISRERLVVHNLPPSWDDSKFKTLLQKYSSKSAIIKEARVMRDMKNIDSNGLGKSKEFGFVAFTKHEDALMALRGLNNNPNVFAPTRRPIVTFSIENKSMLRTKQKRLEKSQINNPKCKNFVANDNKNQRNNKYSNDNNRNSRKKKLIETGDQTDEMKSFSGVASKPGTVQKMRSRYKLTTQAQLHYENLKKEQRKRKFTKKSLNERKKDFIKQPKQKVNKKADKDHFSKMVNDYKNKILSAPVAKKAKWYE